MEKSTMVNPRTSTENPYFNLEVKANEIYRKDTLDMCIRAKTGHVTSSMSCVELLTTLYDGGLLQHDPQNPKWEDRDRFILSKGQASPILYVVLAHQGYFPVEDLQKFCRGEDDTGKNAPFGVHLQCTVPGVEFTTGSLGHGLGYGTGTAKAAKMDGKDYLSYVLTGDGELYEGSNWECALYAAHHKLNNLVVVVDRNGMCTNGYTERDVVKLESIDEKFKAFGWDAKVINGHSIKEFIDAMEGVRDYQHDKPLAIIAKTVKGRGIKSLTDRMYFHGLAPKGEEIEITKRELAEFTEEHKRSGGYYD